jgi:hypothetical protein
MHNGWDGDNSSAALRAEKGKSRCMLLDLDSPGLILSVLEQPMVNFRSSAAPMLWYLDSCHDRILLIAIYQLIRTNNDEISL